MAQNNFDCSKKKKRKQCRAMYICISDIKKRVVCPLDVKKLNVVPWYSTFDYDHNINKQQKLYLNHFLKP